MLREGMATAGSRIRSLPLQNGVDFEYVVLLPRNVACPVRPTAVQLSGSTWCRAAFRFIRPGDGALPCGFQLGRTAGPRQSLCVPFPRSGRRPLATVPIEAVLLVRAPGFVLLKRGGDFDDLLPRIDVTPSRAPPRAIYRPFLLPAPEGRQRTIPTAARRIWKRQVQPPAIGSAHRSGGGELSRLGAGEAARAPGARRGKRRRFNRIPSADPPPLPFGGRLRCSGPMRPGRAR